MVYENRVRSLAKVLLRQKELPQMVQFLTGILTHHELEMINNRLEILDMLRLGWTQTAIVRELDVGISTVSRISKEYQLGRFDDFRNKHQR